MLQQPISAGGIESPVFSGGWLNWERWARRSALILDDATSVRTARNLQNLRRRARTGI